MADENDIIDPQEDMIDPQELAAVIAALAGLTHLDPATEAETDTMPADVWARLETAIAVESAARAAHLHPNVVAFPSQPGTEHRSRGLRWAGGLVAASVTVVAVGVLLSTMSTTGGSDAITAGEAAAPAGQAAAEKSLALAATPEAFADATGAANEAAAQAATPLVQPARVVMASNVNYTRAGLTDQVTDLLDSVDVHSAQEAAAMPLEPLALPVDDGFTQTVETLRACLRWLASTPEERAQVQALVVDRATYEGSDAGVVVAPAADLDPATTPPPTATIESSMGTLGRLGGEARVRAGPRRPGHAPALRPHALTAPPRECLGP